MLDSYLMGGNPAEVAAGMTNRMMDQNYQNAGITRSGMGHDVANAEPGGFWESFGDMARSVDWGGMAEGWGSIVDGYNSKVGQRHYQQFAPGPGGAPLQHPGLLTLAQLINQTTGGL
jgi:hypothetical protein